MFWFLRGCGFLEGYSRFSLVLFSNCSRCLGCFSFSFGLKLFNFWDLSTVSLGRAIVFFSMASTSSKGKFDHTWVQASGINQKNFWAQNLRKSSFETTSLLIRVEKRNLLESIWKKSEVMFRWKLLGSRLIWDWDLQCGWGPWLTFYHLKSM